MITECKYLSNLIYNKILIICDRVSYYIHINFITTETPKQNTPDQAAQI